MIVVFFIGLFAMISGGVLENIFKIPYMSLICNICAIILMCGSSIMFFKNVKKEKFTLMNYIKNLVSKEEHNVEINILESMQIEMKKSNELMLELVKIQRDNKKIYLSELESVNEIKDKMNVAVENEKLLLEYSTKISEKVDSLSEDKKNAIECINEIVNYEQKMNDNLKEMLLQITEMKKNTELINDVYNKIEYINKIPEIVEYSINNLIENFKDTISNIENNIKDLEEHLSDEEEYRTKKLRNMTDEIYELFENSNEIMTDEMKKLSNQYAQFEKLISNIVEEMSHIAEEDIKVLKGFLNE